MNIVTFHTPESTKQASSQYLSALVLYDANAHRAHVFFRFLGTTRVLIFINTFSLVLHVHKKVSSWNWHTIFGKVSLSKTLKISWTWFRLFFTGKREHGFWLNVCFIHSWASCWLVGNVISVLEVNCWAPRNRCCSKLASKPKHLVFYIYKL